MLVLFATILLRALEVAAIVFGAVFAIVFLWVGACYLVQGWLQRKRLQDWNQRQREVKGFLAELDQAEWDRAVRVISHTGHERVGVRR